MTYRELRALPEDGLRHELIDGVHLVSPSPIIRHQLIVVRLLAVLDSARPRGMFAFTAPLDYRISATTVLVPDLLVTPVDDLDRKYLDRPPVLVVEVLSPSTRRVDLHLKKAVLEEAGVPAYWVVDPKSPMLTAFRLVDGSYVADPTVIGRGVYETEFPFPVRVVPADLVRRD